MAAAERAYPAAKFPLLSGGDAAAFFPFATAGEDNLRITSFGSLAGVSLELSGRLRQPDGSLTTFTHVDAASDDRGPVVHDYPLGAGVLLNLTVQQTSAFALYGQVFAIVQLIRGLSGGTTVIGTLLQGYVSGLQALSWPGSPIRHTHEHEGLVRFLFPADPAVNTTVDQVVPAGAIWRVVSVQARLTCSAVAGSRSVFIEYLTGLGGTRKLWVGHPQLIVANGDTWVNFGDGAFSDNTSMATFTRIQGLPAIESTQIELVRVGWAAAQVGDQLSEVVIGVREWLEGRV